MIDPLDHTSIYQKAKEDSDESDGEGSLGNVNRVIMRPPGHSGKAKRGHLCFDASFETGNLGRIDLINEHEYDLFIRADTCNPKLRFWFNFTVDNVRQDQRVIFNIVNISNPKNLFNSNMCPIVRSTSRFKWQRMPKEYVFYHRSPLHQNNYVLSFIFIFDKEDEMYQFALTYPYSYSKLQAFLSSLDFKVSSSANRKCFRREFLANSIQKRRVDLITIGPKDNNANEKQRIIIIMARVHPGESPSSFVCQGLVEFLASSHAVPSLLREYVTFKIIPMVNPDGVFLGNYRSSLMGFDLNRVWHLASPWGHPTLKAMLDMIVNIDKSKDCQLDIILDIQAHSSLTGCFIYGNSYGDVYRYERHTVLPKILSTVCDDYVSDNTMFNADPNKSGSARRYLCENLSSQVNCYTYHVSFFGYKLHGSDVLIPYTEDGYMRCGRNLIKALLEYYKAVGAIPEIPASVKTKKPLRRRPKSTARNSNRLSSTRTPVTVHFKELYINYDSELSAEEYPNSCRNYQSPTRFSEKIPQDRYVRKVGGGGVVSKGGRMGSPPPVPFMVTPEPSLSIVDFNVITREDLEEACKRNKHIV